MIGLTANVGIENGKAGYTARAEFMDIGISASADVKIETVKVYFEAEMCINPGNRTSYSIQTTLGQALKSFFFTF